MSLLAVAGTNSTTGKYDVSNSLKFDDATNERLRRDNPNSGQRRTYTVSMWLKRTELGYNRIWGVGISGNDIQAPYFKDTDEIIWYDYGGGGYRFDYRTNRKFRDTSAWYHLVFAVDTEQSTEADRVKLYVNGVEETSFYTQTEPSQNADTNWNYQGTWDVGTAIGEDPHFSGYMSEVYFIDDQQLDCTNFGEFDDDTGIWKPKAFSGTFGSNDVYANFDDASSLGADSSGNSNDWTLVNITSADQATDTPTNNFCTWLSDGTLFNQSTDNETFSEGGTRFNTRSGTGWTAVYPTQSFAGGKWYMEVKVNENSATNMYGAMPVRRINSLRYQEYHHGQDVDGSIGIYANNGQIYWGTAGSGGSGGALSAGDIVGLAIDMENYKMYFAVNNTYVESGNPAGNSNGRDIEQEPYVFSVAHYTTSTVEDTNFGGYTAMSNTHTNTDDNGYGSFVYAPPSGFLAVCTKNLGENGG